MTASAALASVQARVLASGTMFGQAVTTSDNHSRRGLPQSQNGDTESGDAAPLAVHRQHTLDDHGARARGGRHIGSVHAIAHDFQSPAACEE